MDLAQQVKAAVDIVRVVSDYVSLQKSGPNRYRGLCPFHGEKTPSFYVHSDHQFFKCFGCGKGGDVFTFVMEQQGLTFFEALKLLAEQHGIALPERRSDPEDPEVRRRDALDRMHQLACAYYREQLKTPEAAEVRAYLERRAIAPETAERFELGYAPPGSRLTALLRREGFSEDDLDHSGLAARSDRGGGWYDRFRERLIFPIADARGRVIAFGGRALKENQPAKYLNSDETALYKKSQTLFNLHRAKEAARRSGRLVLVEGYMDVMGVVQAGVEEAVASCGTALTPQQVRVMRRLADTLVVNFDADDAGRNAAEKGIEQLLPEGFHVRVLELPGGLDPDEFCRERGAEAYRALLDQAPDYSTWLADRTRKLFDLRGAEGRLAAFDYLKPRLRLAPDKIQRAALASELAERLGIDAGLVLQEFRRADAEPARRTLAEAAEQPFAPGERLLLELLLESAEARVELLGEAHRLAREDGLTGAPLFAAMLAAEQSGAPFDFAAVEARLEDREREIWHRLAFSPDRPKANVEEGRQALAALERRAWERQSLAVRRKIAEAERSGDRAAALALLRERVELERRLGLARAGTVQFENVDI